MIKYTLVSSLLLSIKDYYLSRVDFNQRENNHKKSQIFRVNLVETLFQPKSQKMIIYKFFDWDNLPIQSKV